MIGDHNQRCITKEEFEEQKRKILQEMSSLYTLLISLGAILNF